MKLARDEFKAMLKECILELVQEGKIFQGVVAPASPSSSGAESASTQSGGTSNNKLNEAVQLTARMVAKGDPRKASLYESIIADTARTTLQKQLSAQMTGGGELNEGAVLPEEKAFDQAQLGAFAAKDRWALLAFGGKSNK